MSARTVIHTVVDTFLMSPVKLLFEKLILILFPSSVLSLFDRECPVIILKEILDTLQIRFMVSRKNKGMFLLYNVFQK